MKFMSFTADKFFNGVAVYFGLEFTRMSHYTKQLYKTIPLFLQMDGHDKGMFQLLFEILIVLCVSLLAYTSEAGKKL